MEAAVDAVLVFVVVRMVVVDVVVVVTVAAVAVTFVGFFVAVVVGESKQMTC